MRYILPTPHGYYFRLAIPSEIRHHFRGREINYPAASSGVSRDSHFPLIAASCGELDPERLNAHQHLVLLILSSKITEGRRFA
jgi:hypothetical protein